MVALGSSCCHGDRGCERWAPRHRQQNGHPTMAAEFLALGGKIERENGYRHKYIYGCLLTANKVVFCLIYILLTANKVVVFL